MSITNYAKLKSQHLTRLICLIALYGKLLVQSALNNHKVKNKNI